MCITGPYVGSSSGDRLSVASAISRWFEELHPNKSNINRLYDPAVAQQWESYLADLLSIVPENIDGHWIVIKNDFFSGATQVIGHVPKGRHKIWLTTESWKRIDDRKELKGPLTATSDGGRDALELRYRAKSR